MGHLILVFIFGMVVLRHDSAKDASESTMADIKNEVTDAKIEEKPEQEKEIERTAIPQVENTEVTEVTE